jgi:hypothetical protein
MVCQIKLTTDIMINIILYLVHHVRLHHRVLNTLHLGSRHNSVVFPGDGVNNSAILEMLRIGDSPAKAEVRTCITQ